MNDLSRFHSATHLKVEIRKKLVASDSAVAYFVLYVGSEFGHGFSILRNVENRIVTKTACSSCIRKDFPAAFTLKKFPRSVRKHQSDAAYELGISIFFTFKFKKQFLVVLVVRSTLTCIPLRLRQLRENRRPPSPL